MRRKRLLPALVQLLLAVQMATGSSLLQTAPAQAAQAPAAATPSPALQAPTPTPAPVAGGGCTVDPSPGNGALLTTCPDAASYAAFTTGLQVAMDALKDGSATGRLTVTSDPAGASVSLNGVDSGLTPLDIAVPPGVYLVRIAKDGYVPFSHVAQVADGVPTTVAKPLDPADTGNSGSFNWVRPEQIINLLGSGGYPDGSFDITGYVRDKDGADYVSFANSKVVEISFDEPTEFDHSRGWQKSDRGLVTTVGVARSRDDGATWIVLKSWTGSYTAREWTSAAFDDSQWATGDPGTIKSRWIRAYYYSRKSEEWFVWAMVPKPEGGVAVYATKSTFDQPQELKTVWDSLPTYNANGYCRADDTDRLCLMAPHQGRYMTSLVPPYTGPSLVENGSGPYKTVASASAISRYGVSPLDLATYNQVHTVETTVVNTSDGGETSIRVEPFCCGATYQGSYKDADYFLSMEDSARGTKGFIYVARNGAEPKLETTYTLGADAPTGRERSEELRIGPDGTLYILDHYRGMVFVLENGNPVLLGRVPASVWGGLLGPVITPLNYLSAAIDSGGNVQAAFRVGTPGPDGTTYTTAKVYYEYFGRKKVAFDSVALFTTADCPACDAARTWLTDAGVPFQENPGGLSASVAASVAAAQTSAGFPVIARLGAETVVMGAAEPGVISRLLGVSYPVLVDTHPIRLGKTAPGVVDPFNSPAYQPDWVLMVLEADQPRLVVQRDEGVVAFAPAGGSWTATKLLNSPPPVPVTVVDGAVGFHPRYPIFPGGMATPYIGTARDVPFNTITKVGDLRFLFLSDGGDRSAYTLNTTKSAPTASLYHAIESVSQLIPSAAFYVALGPEGSPGKVQGELAGYVTSEGVVTDNGYRFYRVVVDLRAQNETAADGNIWSRAIAGAVQVKTKTKDGTADTRDVSLIMLVENARLRTFDPDSRAASSDLTTEAIHFTGSGEKWVVSNNIALPNSISCAGGASLRLEPNSVSTFSAAQVVESDLGSCLDGVEVQPTVLSGCTSWDDAKLLLAAQTISALSNSLSLSRSESVTNWELTFGSRDATIYRAVSLDHAAGAAGQIQCATEATGRTAAIVRISGRFLGADEAYTPTLAIVDSGTTPVSTAPTTQPDSIAFEREWLEFESAFLENNLRMSIGDAAISSVLFLNLAGKQAGYKRQLLGTRALLHCNQEGRGIGAVKLLMARSASLPEALRGTVACLNDFALHPSKHWPGYDRRVWSGGAQDATFLGSVIDWSIASNPTLGWLAANGTRDATTYGRALIAHAQTLLAKASTDPIYQNTATDFALDDYARLATTAAKEIGESGLPLLRAIVLDSQLERSAIRTVVECVKSFKGAHPLEQLIERTSGREYGHDITCVRERIGAARVERYRLLAIGLRSGIFGALYDASGRDLDLVMAHLDLVTTALSVVEAAEARFPVGTSPDAWRPDLPALDRLVIATRQLQSVAEHRGKQITVKELPALLAGVTECGIGFVTSLKSVDGILMLAGGLVASVAGPTAAAAGGLLFVGFGGVVSAYGARDLAQVWETLDLTAKTSGVCGIAVSTLMTVGGAWHAVGRSLALTPAQLRLAPPKVINVESVATHGRAAGLPLEEQGAITEPLGETIIEEPAPPEVPIEPALKAVVDALPEGQRSTALDAALHAGYDAMTPVEQSVVRAMLASDSPAAARATVLDELALKYEFFSPKFKAWDLAGRVLLEALDPNRPRSLAAHAVAASEATSTVPALPTRLAGSDADILTAAGDPNRLPPTNTDVPAETLILRQAYLLEAVLGSDRLLEALQDPGIRRLYKAEEAATFLSRSKAVRDTTTVAFFNELSGTRLLDSLRLAVQQAQTLAGSPGKFATALETEMLGSGQSKTAVLLTIHLDGAQPVQIVAAKGAIGLPEAKMYAELGPKDITQKLLAPLVEHADGSQAVLFTEYAPGRKVPPGAEGLHQLVFATAEAPYAGAIGSLDGRIWLRTKTPNTALPGSPEQALFNGDLHMGNINVSEKGGTATARVVDFDPAKDVLADEDGYWLATLCRRSPDMHAQDQAVVNYHAYLEGIVEAYAVEPGFSRQAGFDMLRRIAAEIETPAGRAKAEAIYLPITVEAADLGSLVAKDIRGFLAANGQSRVPGPVVAVWAGATVSLVPPGVLALAPRRRIQLVWAALVA